MRYYMVALVAAAISLQSCMSEHNSIYVEVEPRGWADGAQIDIENVDSVTKRNIAIYMRYRPSRELAELPLTISTSTPSGAATSDKITLYHAQNRDRRWSSTQFMEVQYRVNVVWREMGRYTMIVTPTDEVKGVELIGVKITESAR